MVNKYFSSLIKKCESECEADWQRKSRHLQTVLTKIFNYINDELSKNPNIKVSEIYEEIEGSIKDYLVKISTNNVRNKTIEYYLSKKAFANKTELRKKYDGVLKLVSNPGFDIEKYDFTYTFNMEKNLEKLLLKAILMIRERQCEIIDQNPELVDKIFSYGHISGKERIKKLRRENYSEKSDAIDFDEKSYKYLLKSEYQLVEDMLKENFEDLKIYLKEDCINCIVQNVKILDKFGFMEHYTKSNDRAWSSLLMKDIVSYDEVMDLLGEENLKKLSIEKLILLSSFWSNRVNKVISSVNESLYIITHKDLLKELNTNEDGSFTYGVSENDKKAVNLKFKVLHKICFEMFEEIEIDRKDGETKRNPKSNIKKALIKYGKQYEEYFNKLLPNSENSLEEDLWFSTLYENIRYNSYKVKDKSIEALLVCLFNNDSSSIENYGYREERNKKGRKHCLIAVDMKGLNMPLMLHVNKQLLLDFLQESEEKTLFPIYMGGDDFYFENGEEFNAQIYIPLNDEIQERILKRAKSIVLEKKKDRTLRHIVYLTENGKMPEHMMEARKSKKGIKYKFVRKYIDLGESDNRRSQER